MPAPRSIGTCKPLRPERLAQQEDLLGRKIPQPLPGRAKPVTCVQRGFEVVVGLEVVVEAHHR
jgi:hypothetical protein